MSLEPRFKFGNMFKRLGKELTFKLLSTIITDSFYQEGDTTVTTYTCYGTVVPARAYDLHSNIATKVADTGIEPMGIVSIFISPADAANINIGDYYIDDVAQYTIKSNEVWSDEYYILEGQVNDIVVGLDGNFGEL